MFQLSYITDGRSLCDPNWSLQRMTTPTGRSPRVAGKSDFPSHKTRVGIGKYHGINPSRRNTGP